MASPLRPWEGENIDREAHGLIVRSEEPTKIPAPIKTKGAGIPECPRGDSNP